VHNLNKIYSLAFFKTVLLHFFPMGDPYQKHNSQSNTSCVNTNIQKAGTSARIKFLDQFVNTSHTYTRNKRYPNTVPFF